MALEQLKRELERFGEQNDGAQHSRGSKMLNITRDTGELLAVLDYPANKAALQQGTALPVTIRGAVRWLTLGYWALPGVNEEASRYFTDTALPRTLIVISDCTEQQQQHQQGRLDRLKQQMTNGKLLAAMASGDLDVVVSLLHPDVTFTGDSNRKAPTAARVIHGRDKVARFLLGLGAKYGPERLLANSVLGLVNGELGVYSPGADATDDAPAIMARIQALTVRDGRVVAIYDVANPDKFTGSPLR